ncbi:DUF2975 domain-containing protein [Marinobacter sp. CHS3-4]|uniref:DUF2975 domain-containing protein n=1 Tax=Marinobacter sp. CHS3-4 TaxID=3045174 RepID=UPI0024B51DF3|nr:DUF2975 domain-containing protein [Marinobacter sp. CHS3-4]MDI9244621.1 DUF2975 domain-containing protein [Marinobacter sp. CHS3-4]
MHEKDQFSVVQKFAYWLNLLVWIAAVVNVAELVVLFASDIPIALHIGGELWSKSISTFEVQDRLVIAALLGIEHILWLAVLWQIWLLCGLYRQSKVFTVPNALCFLNVGWILLGLCLFEVALAPVVGAYLFTQDIIPQMPDWMDAVMFNSSYLVPGLFMLLVAKIMEHAARIQEESELTI